MDRDEILNDVECKVLSAIQYGLPMSQTPYQDVAAQVGIPTSQLLGILSRWKADGKIRRLGAIVNHFQMGRGHGAMVAWNVPAARAEEVGTLFASFEKVSHAYRRPAKPHWPYTLYTMVHADSAGDLKQTIDAMASQSGLKDFRCLRTVRELKKVPPTYILNNNI